LIKRDKSESIFRRCWKRIRRMRRSRRNNGRRKEKKTSKCRRHTRRCLISKKKIVKMRLKLGKEELKNS
jgi:hypothetical protein